MLFLEAIKKYLNDSLIRKTIGTYNFEKEHLNALFVLLGNINLNDVDFYYIISQYRNKELSNNTINKRIGLLKRVLKFNNISYNNVKKLYEVEKNFNYLNSYEIKLLVNYLKSNLSVKNNLSIRNTQIIFVFIDTGIRLNELLNLKKTDYNSKCGFILLKKTKTHKNRYVYLSDYTNNLLRNYNLQGSFLFGRKLTYSIIYKIFNKIKKELDFEYFSPHVLRHSLATNLLKNGADISFVGKILGHSNLNITKKYLHLDKEYMIDSYKSLYPY